MNDAHEVFSDREFSMTNHDFKRIIDIAYTLTGIKLNENKKNMIYGRLARRLRDLCIPSFSAYCDEISQENSTEIVHFTNAITTNLTSFFRENHHFDFLKEKLIPELMQKNCSSRKIRVWSAGCSTGEEPYSIAMVFREFPELRSWDVKILATDLDSNVVSTAAKACYGVDRVEKIPNKYEKYMEFTSSGESVFIKKKVTEITRFKQLNLLHSWKMRGPFDVIFCRNVVIYFDQTTQKKLFDRYASMLSENGYLFIGHSESLNNVTDRFKSQGRTIYRKVK